MIETDILIIGAGLSGLVLANELKKFSRDLIILEKSRGVGGRISTRRIDEQGLDHGSLHLKHDSYLLKYLQTTELKPRLRIDDEGFFVTNGMTLIPKQLASGHTIHKETRVVKIQRNFDSWVVETDQEVTYQCHTIVLTAPLPQALELLKVSSITSSHLERLQEITYSEGLLALITTEQGESHVPIYPQEVLSITSMNERKLHKAGFVLRMTPSWSKLNFNREENSLLQEMQNYFEQSFTEKPEIKSIELKKWKYLQPETALDLPFIEFHSSLYLIGDSFLYPDARGAIQSARVLAERLNW